MDSTGKKMVDMSLEMLNSSEAVTDIPTIDPNNDFYVMESEKELFDCINTIDESQLEKLDNTILVVNVSQVPNMQDIEEGVTHNIMINEEKGNASNNESRNIHQHVASKEMIQGEGDYHDIENQVEIGIDVQSESANSWESEDQSHLEGDNEMKVVTTQKAEERLIE
ncbi:hypothetical protein FQA39_LY11265 [Lamprigera yunnana]|nr:hypothetical protein FQA39_LY11265 [Lamprigera yunnana]